MPLRRGGRWRKRWRYVGAYCDELLICAARVQVGKLGQTFWAIWDRERPTDVGAHAAAAPRGARRGLDGEAGTARQGIVDYAPDEGSVVRIEARRTKAGELRAFLRFGGGRWVESVCPSGEGEYVWTRKRADVPVECDVRIGDRRWRVKARGVEDESAGYHPHHTVWSWSAGVGRATDGRSVGWNLVSGINDPPERSERAIWVDGEPFEPGPVSFDDLEAIAFDDDSRLAVPRRVRAAKAGEPPARPLHLPPAVRQLLRHARPAGWSSSAASASWSTTTPTGEGRAAAFAAQLGADQPLVARLRAPDPRAP